MLTTKYKIAKFIAYGLLAALLCVLQNTPGLFVLWEVKPMLVAAFAVCVAFFERETAGGLFAIWCGFLCDLMSAYTFGFYMLSLFVLCVAVGLLTQGFMSRVSANAVLFTLVAMLMIQGVAFFFVFFIRSVPDSGGYFLRQMLPMSLYTAATALLLYYPTRWLHNYVQTLIDAA